MKVHKYIKPHNNISISIYVKNCEKPLILHYYLKLSFAINLLCQTATRFTPKLTLPSSLSLSLFQRYRLLLAIAILDPFNSFTCNIIIGFTTPRYTSFRVTSKSHYIGDRIYCRIKILDDSISTVFRLSTSMLENGC